MTDKPVRIVMIVFRAIVHCGIKSKSWEVSCVTISTIIVISIFVQSISWSR